MHKFNLLLPVTLVSQASQALSYTTSLACAIRCHRQMLTRRNSIAAPHWKVYPQCHEGSQSHPSTSLQDVPNALPERIQRPCPLPLQEHAWLRFVFLFSMEQNSSIESESCPVSVRLQVPLLSFTPAGAVHILRWVVLSIWLLSLSNHIVATASPSFGPGLHIEPQCHHAVSAHHLLWSTSHIAFVTCQ
jgi:hypothetical protein